MLVILVKLIFCENVFYSQEQEPTEKAINLFHCYMERISIAIVSQDTIKERYCILNLKQDKFPVKLLPHNVTIFLNLLLLQMLRTIISTS